MKQTDFLKEQIKKTGYPLEIEISSILDTKWEVLNTDSYFDSDEKKIRDIDIVARNPVIKELLPLVLDINLVIECKKDQDFAWVFFTRPLKFDWYSDIEGQYLDELQIITKNFETTQLREIILGKSSFHYNDIKRVAVCFDEFYIQGKKTTYEQKKKETFEAQNQLKKYISYTNEQDWNTHYPDIYRLIMNFPCILFDGQMFEAVVERGEIKLRKAKHILLTTQNRVSYCNWEVGLLIDVVQKNYFEKFLRILNRDIRSLKKTLKEKKRHIEKEIDRTISLIKPKTV